MMNGGSGIEGGSGEKKKYIGERNGRVSGG